MWTKLRRTQKPSTHPHPNTPHPLVYVSQDLLTITEDLLTSYGSTRDRHEGIVYWAGVPCETTWVITTALAPKARTTRGSYNTSVVANAAVVSAVNTYRLQVLAQVHGHPTDWVGHSPGDDVGAFMPYQSFLSVVVPYYGQRGLLPLSHCGIHRFDRGHFAQLQPEDIDHGFVVVPTALDLRIAG